MVKKQKTAVATLDAPDISTAHPPASLSDEERYAEFAHKALQRGMNQRSIADQLVKAGLNRADANRIALQIWKENPAIRRENAMILFGTAALFLAVFLIFQLVPLVRGEGLPEPSVVYVLLLPAAWFLYKAIRAYRDTLL